MQLIEFKLNDRSNAYVDLYGNLYRKCKRCLETKEIDKFNFKTCNSCKYKADLKGGEKYIQRKKKNMAVFSEKAKQNRHLLKLEKERKYYEIHNGKHCKLKLFRCILSGNLVVKPISYVYDYDNKTNVKGDYANPLCLYLAIKKRGRYHQCSQCKCHIDLTLNGKCCTSYVFCSNECRNNYVKDSKCNSRHKRRQLQKDNRLTTERIIRSKIFGRDNYRCYLCNIKVIKYKWYQGINKNDMATLDHIIPLSKGGKHSYDNIKTCCFMCNSKKSDKDLADVGGRMGSIFAQYSLL